MAIFNAERKSVPKYVMACVVALTLSVFLTACGGPKHMITMDVKPTIASKPDKAVLVIVRTSSWGGGMVINNFIDGKMIGQTQGKSFFITEVKPGPHFVMAKAENVAAAKINFEAGRIYFLDQSIFPGIWTMRTGFSPMTAEEAKKQISERGSDYRAYNTGNPGPDMNAKSYEETKADFEREAKEDPKRHKNILEYRGYSKI